MTTSQNFLPVRDTAFDHTGSDLPRTLISMSETTADDAILAWYDKLRPIFIDLVGDYAGKELFMIEGDSLLRHCFTDERIDFDGK